MDPYQARLLKRAALRINSITSEKATTNTRLEKFIMLTIHVVKES